MPHVKVAKLGAKHIRCICASHDSDIYDLCSKASHVCTSSLFSL